MWLPVESVQANTGTTMAANWGPCFCIQHHPLPHHSRPQQSPVAHPDNQAQDIDLLLRFHTERMTTFLRAQTRRDMPALLRRAEAAVASVMRQKEDDLAAATMKTAELQQVLKRAEMERCTWKRVARERESAAMDLNRTLAQVSTEGDAESWCECKVEEEEEEEGEKVMLCRGCGERGSCMVMMPCRHLCCCKTCERSLGLCPVCESLKTASMEVFFV